MRATGHFGRALGIFMLATIFSLNSALAQNGQSRCKNVYVWDFATRDGKRNNLTLNFTEQFEIALIHSGQFRVLLRRDYAKLFAQKENEKGILDLEQIPKSNMDTLKSLQAEIVIFGEIFEDTEHGQLTVTVSFQDFNGTYLAKEPIYFSPREKVHDTKKCQAALNKLVKTILKRKISECKKSYRPPKIAFIGVGLTLASTGWWIKENGDISTAQDDYDNASTFRDVRAARQKVQNEVKERDLARNVTLGLASATAAMIIIPKIVKAIRDRGNISSNRKYSIESISINPQFRDSTIGFQFSVTIAGR